VQELYRGTHWPPHAQVSLLDVEDPDYPLWPTGGMAALLNPKAVVIATAHPIDEKPVEVVVYSAPAQPDGVPLLATAIEVGNKGLSLGDTETEYMHIDWPSGRTQILVYRNSGASALPVDIIYVAFVLDYDFI